MGALDTSHLHELPPMYGIDDEEVLANHYSMDCDDLEVEWSGLKDILGELPNSERTLQKVYNLLNDESKTSLGLSGQYPSLTKLYATASTVSTAEVERVFSQLALVKTAQKPIERGNCSKATEHQAEFISRG